MSFKHGKGGVFDVDGVSAGGGGCIGRIFDDGAIGTSPNAFDSSAMREDVPSFAGACCC